MTAATFQDGSLSDARAFVAAAQERCRRQAELIGVKAAHGYETTESETLLEEFLSILAIMRHREARLRNAA